MFKLIGVSDEVVTCEKCGKTNLKRTVVLQSNDGVVYYGTDCAGRAMGKSTAAVNQDADVITYTRQALQVHTPAIVAQKVWNKFGYLTQVRNDAVFVAGVGLISQ